MTECSHWSPRDLGPGWAHLCSVLKMAKTCLLDMKPFSTSRILRLSRGSMYFFSFSWWRKGRGQLWWTLPQGPWPTSNASHVARSPQMNLPDPSPPRSPDPATLASDSLNISSGLLPQGLCTWNAALHPQRPHGSLDTFVQRARPAPTPPQTHPLLFALVLVLT